MIRRDSDFESLAPKLKQRDVPRYKILNIDSVLEVGNMLGRGRFGVVIHATEKSTGKEHAVKVISKRCHRGSTFIDLTSVRVKLAEREIMILKMVNHPHIILLEKVYDTDQKIYMVFELCKSELGKMVREKKLFTEIEARYVIQGLASAVSYLHKHEIVHRDLKLENILLANNPKDSSDCLYIKLIDFGLSTVKGGVGYEDMLQDFCGTIVYMAPELIGEKLYSHQCDVWAMGVILYFLLSGSFPFYSSNEQTLCDMILENEPSFSEQAWKGNMSHEAVHLTAKMLTKNPAFRITASEVVNHPWVLNMKMSDPPTKNILEMMQLWRDDMKKEGDADWVKYEATKSSEKVSSKVARKQFGKDDSRKGSFVTTLSKSSMNNEAKEAYKKKLASKQAGYEARKQSDETNITAKYTSKKILNSELLTQVRNAGKGGRKAKKTSLPQDIKTDEMKINDTTKQNLPLGNQVKAA